MAIETININNKTQIRNLDQYAKTAMNLRLIRPQTH